MHEVPVIGHPILGRVHAHRGYPDAVAQSDRFKDERIEERSHGAVRQFPGSSLRKPDPALNPAPRHFDFSAGTTVRAQKTVGIGACAGNDFATRGSSRILVAAFKPEAKAWSRLSTTWSLRSNAATLILETR